MLCLVGRLGSGVHILMDIFPNISAWTLSFPFLHSVKHSTLPPPRSADLQYEACTKLIEVDRLGSGVRVSASFQIFSRV